MISEITMKAFCIKQLFGYAITFLWALVCSRAKLAARLLAAEGQLAECSLRIT